jgi:hypothetical protein
MTEAVSEKRAKQRLFSDYFVRYHDGFESLNFAAGADSWQALIRLRGNLIDMPIDALKDRLEDYLEAAYHLGEISGFTTALELAYKLGLAKDYLERPKVLTRLQKLAFEVYWLVERLEKTKIRRNESLAQKTAKLSYSFYRLVQRALKAAKAQLPKSS